MDLSENSQAVFELFDMTLAETVPELLGLWVTNPSSSDTVVAWALNSAIAADAPLWRASLPADLNLASIYLANSEARLDESQRVLSTATDRINLLATTLSSRGEASLAFDLSLAGKELAQPEQDLLRALQELQKIGLPESFGWREELVKGPQQVFEQFQTLTERLLCVIANYAWVETQLQGQTLAQTAVGWTGDMNSVWQEELNSMQVALHQRTLALALKSRNTLLKTFSIAVQAALKLSVLLTMPGGVILALPATWNFMHQVMAQATGEPEQ